MPKIYTIFLNAMEIFSEKMQDLYNLLMINPVTYRGGVLWDRAMIVFQALLGVGFTLILLCGYLGILSSIENIYVARKPEILFMVFGTVTICGGLIAVSPQLLLIIIRFCQGIMKKATGGNFVFAETYRIPNAVINATNGLSTLQSALLFVVFAIGAGIVMVTTFSILLMSYGRIFKLYIYLAISPLALSCLASKATQRVGINYLKVFLQVCIEGLVIILACLFFVAFNDSYEQSAAELTEEQDALVSEYIEDGMSYTDAVTAVIEGNAASSGTDEAGGTVEWGNKPQPRDSATTITFNYIMEQIFLFILLAAIIKGSEKEVQRILG